MTTSFIIELLRCDFLPRVWCPQADVRQGRHSATERANLSADSTRVKNRIHASAASAPHPVAVSDLFSQAGPRLVSRIAAG
jgi:hypothetical protein